ncbi:nuclear transport factor 2 family protein [Pseudoxanthomonas helianthi]|uniref:Nuclear transport factor 2 family protein n=1 Tax=Pseudoxanthomonas helianthi TaxID=1453541 RepID=A0A940X5Q6_9GAMM|nr:nuclear transport factor 2 family protein [Pseudoxanthomonas helianthi]MBP3985542.1 nuclear transport factor 2 family protein [Pseudoxanthomonas helianthi]
MRLFLIPAALAVGLLSTQAFASESAEAAAACVPLESYLKGHATGDGAYMRKAFLPTAHIEGIRDGKFVSWTVDEYAAGFKGTPAADEAQRKRRIDEVDVSGNAAMARVTLDYPTGTFTDYFVLLKVDGEWKIANKVWTRQPKPATP